MVKSTCYKIDESDENEEITLTKNEYNEILNIQQQILEKIASHEATSEILEKLCSLAESFLPNSVASVMLKNKETGLMSVRSAPSIPQSGQDRLANLKPGPNGGSCGNAVFKNKPQFVQNTFTDERWEELRQVAIDFTICSCWSMPIRDEKKNAIGSFALSSFEHRTPNPFYIKLFLSYILILYLVYISTFPFLVNFMKHKSSITISLSFSRLNVIFLNSFNFGLL